jgi:hypothetical protein
MFDTLNINNCNIKDVVLKLYIYEPKKKKYHHHKNVVESWDQDMKSKGRL